MKGATPYRAPRCHESILRSRDATAENSTSYFTQHLVDGLLGAAADHDADGYVTFCELYAYVDRRRREGGRQIPLNVSDVSDTDVFAVHTARIYVSVKNLHGNGSCDLGLYDPVSGTEIDSVQATMAAPNRWPLTTQGHANLYLHVDLGDVAVSAGPASG